MSKSLRIAVTVGLLTAGCARSDHVGHGFRWPLQYENERYGLTFSLPANWQGYSVLIQSWDGLSYSPEKDTTEALQHGPIVVLRNPRWKIDDPYQDIPIMVFTRGQWEALHSGRFFPYAGGVIEELWHNNEYVFGLYSRYNAGDSAQGVKEAADILEGNCATHTKEHLYSELLEMHCRSVAGS